MNSIVQKVSEKLNLLNLSIDDISLSEKIILMAINSVTSYVKCEINPFIEFEEIEDVVVDIVIGEYLALIKSSNIDNLISLENAVNTIKEGDTTITYFENKNISLDNVINYFLDKKRLLYRYKQVVW